jgi:hypothetical protein
MKTKENGFEDSKKLKFASWKLLLFVFEVNRFFGFN